ncbi:MAG: C-methyltransferase [Acidobacteriales bacterium]|nr:C-methyltransferase [Terriglobales bacterium]
MHLVHRKSCRICGSLALTPVIDLGEQYLQGSFVKPGSEQPPLRKIPTVLVRCDPTRDERACGLLQMAHSVPPNILYSKYWYRSGTNQTMRDHLSGIANEAAEMTGEKNARVLDIGCNDGTLLNSYSKSFIKFGVDPSDAAQNLGGEIKVIQDTFPSIELKNEMAGQLFDIVTSIAMFYDLEDPLAFVQAVKQSLAPQGLWIFEMSYMPSMLRLNSYDTICHEHLEYYSLTVLEKLLKEGGMKMIKVGLNDINGGSIRCYATHSNNFKFKKHEFSRGLADLRREEFDLELDTGKPYKNFQERINVHKQQLNSILSRLKQQGKRIHIYGASTKGNTILQWCELSNSVIDFAAERNPDKFGASTLGTNIPIISEAESRAMKPDYYLVLPWHFKQEFLQRERDVIESGTSMIFPLPEVEVITSEKVLRMRTAV